MGSDAVLASRDYNCPHMHNAHHHYYIIKIVFKNHHVKDMHKMGKQIRNSLDKEERGQVELRSTGEEVSDKALDGRASALR